MPTIEDRLAEIARLPAPDREALCTGCGACCHLTVRTGRGPALILTTIRCPYLEGAGPGPYRCSVYDRRFSVAPWCRPIEEFVRERATPPDCPYAAGISDYGGARAIAGEESEAAAERLRGLQARGLLRSRQDPARDLLWIGLPGRRGADRQALP